MCGIYCCVVRTFCGVGECKAVEDAKTQKLLERRGPDRNSSCDIGFSNWALFFKSYVLWMQGNEPVVQPLKDDFGNLLLWNGDIFGGKYSKNLTNKGLGDTAELLLALTRNESSPINVLETLVLVHGPWSMIYWNETEKTLWFGRDALGRHSLLWRKRSNDFIITSVAKRGYNEEEFQEVPAIGIFSMDFKDVGNELVFPVPTLHLWSHIIPSNLSFTKKTSVEEILGNRNYGNLSFSMSQDPIKSPLEIENHINTALAESKHPLPERILSLPPLEALKVLMESWEGLENILTTFIELLKCAVKTRVQIQPGLCKDCIKGVSKIEDKNSCPHPKICVLFSGGIDSTVLALLADLFVPDGEAIDLLNVAFSSGNIVHENFDKVESNEERKNTRKKKISQKKNSTQIQRHSDCFEVPDRKTGKQALAELKTLCPNRHWNFVEIDVPVSELSQIRQEVISDLIHPLNTVLDDSLGCAMWFAARGIGTITVPIESAVAQPRNNKVPYTSPARVALLGTGADEQLGGYSRHRSALEDGGWPLLAAEMNKQVKNLPSRNLGRDDRICSDHGRQPRFPFLDEDVVSFLSSLAPWKKVAANVRVNKKKNNTGNEELNLDQTVHLTVRSGIGDKALLRLAALKLGLKDVCSFPKRAMQFGSRVAKLEAAGKEKANDVCQRLMSNKIND